MEKCNPLAPQQERRCEKMSEETHEMKVLRAFVEVFSPIHQGQTEGMDFDELFDIVRQIIESHYGA